VISWTSRFFGKPKTTQHADRTSLDAYWSRSPEQLLIELQSTPNGLGQADVELRRKQYGPNALKAGSQDTALSLLLNQFKSPLVLILVVAAVISAFAHEWPDAVIVLAVVLGSTTLGFVQEYRASDAIAKLRSRLTLKSSVVRDGQTRVVLSEEIVPGDVVLLSAGSLIPADGIVLEANVRALWSLIRRLMPTGSLLRQCFAMPVSTPAIRPV